MKKFSNCSMTAANITLTLKNGKATYRIYGYTYRTEHEGVESVVLQPADLRCSPVFYAPVAEVASIDVNF